jgi:8-oxo-dGTP diphosphatase
VTKADPIPHRLTEIDWSTWQAVDKATLLFVLRDTEVLLIRKRRGLGAGKINAPGGRLDDGESPRAGAIREVQEEVCVTPLDPDHRGELLFQFIDGYSIHVWVFLATDHHGEACTTDEAIPLWTPLDQIPYDEMWADDRVWLPLMLAGRSFNGRFIFDGDRMLDHEVEALGEEGS